jgi:hypothetical protein
MAYSITIEEVSNNVVVTPPNNNQVTVSTTSFPITIDYNATVVGGLADNGVPVGGTAGQVLSKVDSEDYNTEWIDVPQPDLTGLATEEYVDLAIAAIPPSGIQNIVEDTTPQLGGNLDVNGRKITSASNGNVIIEPQGTGDIKLQSSDQDREISLTNLDGLRVVAGTGKPGLVQVGSNQSLTLRASGTGGVVMGNGQRDVKVFTNSTEPTITTSGLTGSLTINSNNGTNSGSIRIQGQNADLNITPNGTGRVNVSGQRFPGTAGAVGRILRMGAANSIEWSEQVTISENEPQNPYVGQEWLNPTTQILKVYAASGWVQVTADDGQY